MSDSDSQLQKFTFANIKNRTHQNWWKDPGLRRNVFHCVGCCLCTFYLGFDQSLLTGLQAIPAWGEFFDHPKGNRLGLITASLFLPAIIFCIVGGWMANQFGRRVAIWFGALLLTAAYRLECILISYLGRVIMGSGGGIVKVAAPALLQEIAHPRLRPVLGAMYYGFFFTGSITSSWMCVAGLYIKGEWGWRFPAILQVVGPVLVTALTITSPESPRYYVKKGDAERALDILAKYHANGDRNDELVLWELREITVALQQEDDGKKNSYIDFLKTPGNRRRLFTAILLGLGANWLGNGVVSYYLSPVLKSVGITKPLQITSINAGLAMWNLPFAWFGAWGSERWGRRPLFFVSTWGMFFAFAFTMGLSAGFAIRHNSAMGIAVIPFLFIFNAFYAIAWTPLPYHYTTEIMPYSLRTKGLAIYTISNQIGNGFNQFVNPIALDNIEWKYYAVYLGLQVMIFLLEYFLFPETRGLSLEEIGSVFDHGVNDVGKAATRELLVAQAEYEQAFDDKEKQE
ncbi:general substrate transporter [Marasmius fiardii PR-910]|nr:general substrate transporter [Marasmius fiardii PR-910]